MKTRKRRAQDAGREEQQGTSGTQRLEAEFEQPGRACEPLGRETEE